MDVDKAVAGEARARLARARLSNRWVAKQLGWSEFYLSRRLTGAVPFSVGDLAALADLLDVPIKAFFEVPVDHQEDDLPNVRRLVPDRAGSPARSGNLTFPTPLRRAA